MKIIPLLLFFAFVNYLYLGIAAYRLDRKSRVNRTMLLLCLAFALWALAYAFMHATDSRRIAIRWYELSSFGWMMFIPLALHLYLLLSRRERFINAGTLVFMYAPAVAGIVIANVFVFHPGILKRVPGGWVPVYDMSFMPILLFIASYVVYLGVGFVALYLWGKRARFKREKKQMRTILATSVITFTLAALFDNILPLMNITIVPVIAPLMGMIWLVGLWLAIRRYRLMVVTTSFTASDVIKNMRDLMVLVDYDGIVTQASPRTCAALGYDEAGIVGSTMDSLIVEKELINEEMRRFRVNSRESSSSDVHFRTREGTSIPVRLSGSSIRDTEGDLLGVVFVGYDMRETKKLIEMQRMIDIDMEMAARVQAGIFPSPPSEIGGWSVSVVFRPVAAVSGDFYDFYESAGKLRGVSIFDVSGHGVAAGLITMIAKSLVYRIFISQMDLPLNHVAERINADLVRDIGHLDNFITGILLRMRDGAVEYVNAGHTHLLRKRGDGGDVSIVNLPDRDFRGAFLGVPDMASKFDVITFDAAPGDLLLLYTDALVESAGAGREHYGIKRLVDSFGASPGGSPEAVSMHIMSGLEKWIAGRPLDDDLTVIVLRRNG